MIKHFRFRLIAAYLLLIMLIIGIAGSVMFSLFRNDYINRLQESLVKEAFLVSELVGYQDKGSQVSIDYEQICKTAARDSDTRVTILDRNGTVLGDSAYDVGKMELHRDRPEVYQALQGKTGVAVRYSETLKVKMLYVAVPFNGQQTDGIIRMAMPLKDLEDINHKIISIMLLATLIAGLVGIVVSLMLARHFSRPIQEITDAVKDISHGNLKRRIHYDSDDEFGVLARTFNDMGDSIDRGVTELSELKDRFETLLDQSINGIVMIDTSALLIYANPVAVQLLDLKDAYIGRKYAEVFADYALIEMVDYVYKNEQALRKEIVMHVLRSRTVEVNVVPIESQYLSSQGILIILHDITEKKRLEQVRKDFVANVSHELKTPVAVISGFAETFLAEQVHNPEDVREFAQIIYDESQRLSRLLERLLELSRLESEAVQANFESLDIRDLIQNTVDLMKKHEAEIQLESILPLYPVVISTDADLVSQVLMNLLDNAIKYNDKNAAIKVYLSENDTDVTVYVEDKGGGIPEKDLPRIFERFYRVDKARSRQTGGTGLGLAIVKHLVENLGGQVGVNSRPGEGSVFYFILPRK